MKNIDKQLSYAPAEVHISYCGFASPAMQQMQDLFKKQITLLCYEKSKSVEELSEILQTDKVFIQDAVNSLTSLKMMKCKNGKYLTTFPMIHKKKNYDAEKMNYELIQKLEIPKKINKLIFSLSNKIKTLDFYGNNFDISYLNWFLYTELNNCILSELRTYYSDKTNEIVLNKDVWQSQNYDFSLCAFYNFADEKIEKQKLEKRLDKISTYYNRLGSIQCNNCFDAPPFPSAFYKESSSYDYNGGRNQYLTLENIDFYLNLVKGTSSNFTESEKQCLKDFIKHGIVQKTQNGYKPMIPVFTQEVFSELQKMLNREVIPLVKEIVESSENTIENLLIPQMHDVKERIEQFYTYWLCYFLCPIQELYWYGMNQEGLYIPKDYNRSAAGMYVVV